MYEIKNSGYEKKLSGGIVITGGGSQLKHLPQLVEYFTGMDCRIGTPNEHLAKTSENITNPIFATGVGLVMLGIKKMEAETERNNKVNKVQQVTAKAPEKDEKPKVATHSKQPRTSILENFTKKVGTWLKDDIE
jgi:cell division protein FtsA